MAVVVDDLSPLVHTLHVLHGGVAEHPEAKEHDGADDHRKDADAERARDEGDHEAEGLPHPVVGEGGLLLGREQGSVKGVNLNNKYLVCTNTFVRIRFLPVFARPHHRVPTSPR